MLVNINTESTEMPRDRMTLHLLPYDLLFNVAQNLELRDVHALQLVSFPSSEIDSQLLIARIIYQDLQVVARLRPHTPCVPESRCLAPQALSCFASGRLSATLGSIDRAVSRCRQ